MIFRPPHLKFLVVLIICILPIAAWGQQITFTYNPPDSTQSEVILTTEEKVISAMQDYTHKRIDHFREMYVKTDSNYNISRTLINSEAYFNNELQDTSNLSFLIDRPLVYIADFDGHLDSLTGYAKWQDAILSGWHKEFSEDMPHYYDYKPFFVRTLIDWNARLGNFAGRTFAIGDTIQLVDTVINLEGTSIIAKKIWFAEMLNYNGANCVKIEYEHNIDKIYSEEYTQAQNDSIAGSDYDFPKFTSDSLKDHTIVKGRQIINPATMLIYYTNDESTTISSGVMYGGLYLATQQRINKECIVEYEFKKR
jgi:hypothetical protein